MQEIIICNMMMKLIKLTGEKEYVLYNCLRCVSCRWKIGCIPYEFTPTQEWKDKPAVFIDNNNTIFRVGSSSNPVGFLLIKGTEKDSCFKEIVDSANSAISNFYRSYK
jgi:hypothetical protein